MSDPIPAATLRIECAQINPPKPLGCGVFVEGKIIATVTLENLRATMMRLHDLEMAAIGIYIKRFADQAHQERFRFFISYNIRTDTLHAIVVRWPTDRTPRADITIIEHDTLIARRLWSAHSAEIIEWLDGPHPAVAPNYEIKINEVPV
jgi:hypothetical protein